MAKSYSVAEARNNLPHIVHEVEHSRAIEITRRGRPVAVIVSKEEYDRLLAPKKGFWTVYQELRSRFNLDELEIDPSQVWGGIRDKSPGRDVNL